jgi:hypothetical protein
MVAMASFFLTMGSRLLHGLLECLVMPSSSTWWNYALSVANLEGSRRRNLAVANWLTVVMKCCTPCSG